LSDPTHDPGISYKKQGLVALMQHNATPVPCLFRHPRAYSDERTPQWPAPNSQRHVLWLGAQARDDPTRKRAPACAGRCKAGATGKWSEVKRRPCQLV